MRKLGIIFALLAFSKFGFAQLAAVNGDCTIGGQQALTQGLASTATQQIGTTNVLAGAGVQASFPNCTVSVFVTNTATLALIYSNSLSTPLANPFIANNDGSWTFWAAQGQGYDVVLSSGSGPALPYTRLLPGIFLGGSGGGGGGITLINTILPITGGPITTAGTLAINNATTVTTGVIQLAGDLCGLGTAPTVCNGSHITNSSIPNSGLVNTTVTISPGTGLAGGGAVALGSSITLSLANIVTSGSCTNCSLSYNAQGQITLASSGAGGGGISGIGTTNKIPVWTSSSSIGNSDLTYVTGTNNQYTSTALWNIGPTNQLGSGAGGATLVFNGGFNLTGTGSSSVVGFQYQMVDQSNNASAVASTQTGFDETIGAAAHAASGTISTFTGRQLSVQPSTINNTTNAYGDVVVMGASPNATSATITNQYGRAVKFNYGSTNTITNDYGFIAFSPVNIGATVTHHYGFYCQDQTTAGIGSNPDPWCFFEAGTAPNKLGGALTVVGSLTLSSLSNGCLNVTTGVVTSTGLACGSGGSGSVITINGGGSLASPTDFRNGTGARIVNGITIQFANPTGAEVEAAISGTLTNAGLTNSFVTLAGTGSQITVTGGGPLSLGGTATLSFPTLVTFPGKVTFAASTTGGEAFNIPSGVAPTSIVSGSFWNQSGILHFGDGANNNSLVTIQTALVNGHIPKAVGTNGLLADGYGVQGTDTNLITSGTITGTNTAACSDANGGIKADGTCPSGSGGLSGMVANGLPIAATATTVTSSLNSNITGQVPTFQNGGPPIATSPSLSDSVNSPVNSASYTLACDTATALIDRAHLTIFTSGASTPIVPLSSASGCPGFVNTVIDESAGALVFGRSGADTFSVYNGSTGLTAQTSFTLNNGQYATIAQSATGIWRVLIKSNSSLPSGTQGQVLANTSGSNAYATTLTLGIDLAQYAGTIPFTTGSTTPTVDVTTAFNALISTVAIGTRIVFPPNSHYKFAPVAGAQAAVPILKNGLVFACGGGPGAQYTAALATAECSVHMATAGGYVFGVGQYLVGPSVTPAAGPQFINMTFVDDTAKSNAGGQIYVADTNNVLVDNLTAFGGWRQPALAAPSAPTCTQSNTGGTITGTRRIKIADWTTSGPTLPSTPATCTGTAPAGSGSIVITVPASVAPVIGHELYCETGASTGVYVTCSPLPTYTTNGDGSQTINLQTASPLTITANPTSTRVPTVVDLSHEGGISFNGSNNWTTANGFSNGPRVTNSKHYLVQGAITGGFGAASVNIDKGEISACDVVVATGACGAGSATPGIITGIAGMRITNTHGTGSSSSSSTGPMVTLTGFNNSVANSTLQSNTAGCPGSCTSTETGISLVSATGTQISGVVLANFGTGMIADANSTGNKADFADNGTNGTIYTDNGTGNQWLRAGKTFVLAASTTAGASINLPHGVAPTSPNNGDIWTTTTGQFDRINGTSITMAAAGTGGAGSTTCTNQFVSVISATAAPTCTSITLASAQFANQGTTTTVLHGNAAGNPSFGSIVAADITSATITGTQIASSIALAGSPTTTTQSAKDNSTKIATTAYVDAPTPLTTGTSVTLSAPRQYFVCTGTCTITVPVPAAGYEFCVMNDDNVATVITMSAIGSSARYENTARTAYGTAGTGTFVSGGAVGDKVCLLGRDATHYLTASFNGVWVAN